MYYLHLYSPYILEDAIYPHDPCLDDSFPVYVILLYIVHSSLGNLFTTTNNLIIFPDNEIVSQNKTNVAIFQMS